LDTIIIVLVFIGWMAAYSKIEKYWKKYTTKGKLVISSLFLVYMTIIYLIGYNLTKIF
jgi:hypothetical protein